MTTENTSQGANLVDGRYSIRDLVDLPRLERILSEFSLASGFTTGFVSYPDQELLFGTGWRRICTGFHRACEASEAHCKASNQTLTAGLDRLRQINLSHCDNGLVDGATPIVVRGVHLANLFTGQILFEPPDLERFRQQAVLYDFDLDDYLAAVTEVPVVTEAQFNAALTFLGNLAEMIVEQSLANLETERRKAELRRHKEHLEELVDARTQQLVNAQQELVRKERLATLGQVAATVSHELRNPLSTVRNALFVVGEQLDREVDHELPPSVGRALDLAERNIVRCDRIIDELLQYTRVEPLKPRPTELDRWLGQVLDMLEAQRPSVNLERELQTPDSLLIDRDKLRRTVLNLVNNALDAADEMEGERGRVTIATRRRGDQLEIQVRDRGPGMSEQVLARVFEPLFSTKPFGVGLGLPAVQNIVRQLEGELALDSRRGQGTTVTLRLPANETDGSHQ